MSYQEEEYETSDIYLAAYLRISGCKLERRRKQGNRVLFVFTNPAGSVKEMREAYFSGSANVVASKFAQEIKNFKELCYD